MTKNNRGMAKPATSTTGQSTKQTVGKGGTNKGFKPFGQPLGSSANTCDEPRHGTKGQRLASGGGKGATGYPPGYTSR